MTAGGPAWGWWPAHLPVSIPSAEFSAIGGWVTCRAPRFSAPPEYPRAVSPSRPRPENSLLDSFCPRDSPPGLPIRLYARLNCCSPGRVSAQSETSLGQGFLPGICSQWPGAPCPSTGAPRPLWRPRLVPANGGRRLLAPACCFSPRRSGGPAAAPPPSSRGLKSCLSLPASGAIHTVRSLQGSLSGQGLCGQEM